jgi:hypothetical protein
VDAVEVGPLGMILFWVIAALAVSGLWKIAKLLWSALSG